MQIKQHNALQFQNQYLVPHISWAQGSAILFIMYTKTIQNTVLIKIKFLKNAFKQQIQDIFDGRQNGLHDICIVFATLYVFKNLDYKIKTQTSSPPFLGSVFFALHLCFKIKCLPLFTGSINSNITQKHSIVT